MDEEELAKPPDTEEESAEEIRKEEEDLKEIRARSSEEILKRIDELKQTVTKLGNQLAKATFRSPAMEEARAKPARDPNEKARNRKPDPTVQKAEKKVREILDKNEDKKAATRPEPSEKRPADAKEWAGSKFVYFVTAATFFGPTLLQVFEGLCKAMTGDKSALDALGLPDEIAVKLMNFATEKKQETNDAYWKDIGDFVAKQTDATRADLIMTLQYVVKTNPINEFTWPSLAEAGTMAATLAPKFTNDPTERGKFFAGLSALKASNGRALPRATAAAVAQNAIALTLP